MVSILRIKIIKDGDVASLQNVDWGEGDMAV